MKTETDTPTEHPSAATDGSARKKRRSAVHKCGHCGAEFSRKLECWAHMESCEEIKRLRREKAAKLECPRCMAKPCMCAAVPAIRDILSERHRAIEQNH